MADPIIGIDLGTSNTVVAHADATGPAQVLADANGYKIHPSVVSFHPSGGVVVGAAAKQRKVIDPKNTIFSVKRLIGRAYTSTEVQTAKKRMPYEIKAGANQLPLIVTRGGEFAIPEISAIVLDHARTIASSKLQTEVGRAVVTVPASFNDAQRSATATAGSIAGLTVVRVLNEPTAAALAYGNARNLNETIAVYDFGGGTFDITILRLADQVYEVLGTAGNTFLGGDDLDERLVDRMVDKFLAENRVDLRSNEVSMMRLRAVAEQTKIELSRRSRAVVRVDEIAYGPRGKPLDLQIEIRRDEFVKQVADIIDKTFPVCEEALKYANLTIDGIDDVILVGGTTKIPYVRDQVAKFFGKAPRTDVNPEEAVAAGAALQATALERVLSRKKSSVSQVTGVPRPVGVSFEEEESSFGGTETQTFTREGADAGADDQTSENARAQSSYSQKGVHHDRFETVTPPPAPPGAPVIGRLTKEIKPPPAATKTAQGVAQAPPPSAASSKSPRKTAIAVPIMRPPAAATPAAVAKPLAGQISTVIVDPSATAPGMSSTSEDLDFPNYSTETSLEDLDFPNPGTEKGLGKAGKPPATAFDDAARTRPGPKAPPPTSEDLDFPDHGTEKGFLDLDDSISPASTAKGFGSAAATKGGTASAAGGVGPTSEDLDFPDYGTEKGFLDLDDASTSSAHAYEEPISPATTAKGFTPPAATSPTMRAQAPSAIPTKTAPAAQPPRRPGSQPGIAAPHDPTKIASRPPSRPGSQPGVAAPHDPTKIASRPGQPASSTPAASMPTMMGQPAPSSRPTMIADAPQRPGQPSPSSMPTMIAPPAAGRPAPPPAPSFAPPPPPPPFAPTPFAPPPEASRAAGRGAAPLPPPPAPPPSFGVPVAPGYDDPDAGFASPPTADNSSGAGSSSAPMVDIAARGPLQAPVWPPPSASPRPLTSSPVIMDVTPRGLGIGTVAGFCEELIRRNSRVPTEIRKLFTTSRDHQDAVRIIVCQGESRRLDSNVVIGDLLLQGLPRRPRGETSIEVTFHLDANGILQVRARDAQTGNEQRASLDLVGAMPEQDVSASRERLAALRR